MAPRRKRVPHKLPALPPAPPVPLTAECFIVSSRATFDQVQVTALRSTYTSDEASTKFDTYFVLSLTVLDFVPTGSLENLGLLVMDVLPFHKNIKRL